MRKYIYYIVLLIVHCEMLTAQNDSVLSQNIAIYGNDVRLVNGFIYEYELKAEEGYCYLFNEEPVLGSLRIEDKLFINQYLKFDIFHNHLILSYRNEKGGVTQIQLVDSMVQSFSLLGHYFEKQKLPKMGVKFVEVLNNGHVQYCRFWFKDIKLISDNGMAYHRISAAQKFNYLIVDQKITRIRGNRTFIRSFTLEQKSVVKKILHSNNVRIGKASDSKISLVMSQINNSITN